MTSGIGPLNLVAGDTIHIEKRSTSRTKTIRHIWHNQEDGYYIVFEDGTNLKEREDGYPRITKV